MRARSVLAFLCLLQSVIPLGAEAGQPLVTDDAALVAPKTCQVEAWTIASRDATAYLMQPACNPTGNFELAVGVGTVRPDEGARSSLIQLQGKTVLHALEDKSWSFGVVGGAARDTGQPRGGPAFQMVYAKGLASWYPSDDLEIDLNLGGANTYGYGSYALAGAAVQYRIIDQVQLLAEVIKDAPGKPAWQAGARFFVIPDQLEAYVAYRSSFGEWFNEWGVNIGIRLQTPAFLP